LSILSYISIISSFNAFAIFREHHSGVSSLFSLSSSSSAASPGPSGLVQTFTDLFLSDPCYRPLLEPMIRSVAVFRAGFSAELFLDAVCVVGRGFSAEAAACARCKASCCARVSSYLIRSSVVRVIAVGGRRSMI
jgi:hypothetical protein